MTRYYKMTTPFSLLSSLMVIGLPLLLLSTFQLAMTLLYWVGSGVPEIDAEFAQNMLMVFKLNACSNMLLLPLSSGVAILRLRRHAVVKGKVDEYGLRLDNISTSGGITVLSMATVMFAAPFFIATRQIDTSGSIVDLFINSLKSEWRLFLVESIVFPIIYVVLTWRNDATRAFSHRIWNNQRLRTTLLLTWPLLVFGLMYATALAFGWALLPAELDATLNKLNPLLRVSLIAGMSNIAIMSLYLVVRKK